MVTVLVPSSSPDNSIDERKSKGPASTNAPVFPNTEYANRTGQFTKIDTIDVVILPCSNRILQGNVPTKDTAADGKEYELFANRPTHFTRHV
jgi:hypothetical protein